MSSLPDTTACVTDVVFVDSVTAAPTGYTVLPSSLYKKKCYLCYATKEIANCDSTTLILADLKILSSGDPSPGGYRRLTEISSSAFWRSRIVWGHFVPFASVSSAIGDILISDSSLDGFILAGEVNSLKILCKQVAHRAAYASSSTPKRPPPPNHSSAAPKPPAVHTYSWDFALSGVPVELNRKYFPDAELLYDIPCKTFEELEREYQYSASVERSLLGN
ncbi:hypothetical protein CRM22_010089 [Opisthorchis felineus]|uniref:Uncharacterized protein n=1 Tax=Opisthorchis felineus TaxID=147828 RepID=A0A4S2L3Q9_OPIFE|nr:hypothetical protein CRM22_010089 [Opisthorchis felineus]